MRLIKGAKKVVLGSLVVASLLMGPGSNTRAEDEIQSYWYLSPGIGWLELEGDEAVNDGVLLKLRLGYDLNESWTFEADLSLAPRLTEDFYGVQQSDGSVIQYSRLEAYNNDPSVDSVTAVGLAVDAMYHFTRWKRVDPYLTVGAGLRFFDEAVNRDGSDTDHSFRAGGGVMYHFNDVWAARVDGRVFLAGQDTEGNAGFDAGVIWTWGAGVESDIGAVGGPLDSDLDGLLDTDEFRLETDHLNPDTDGDGLKDGAEVHRYGTNPLEKDTDLDRLTDGQEVLTYNTDPLDQDTDDGGVDDGHEVIEDGTNPRKGHGDDDLMRYMLYIQFDRDKAIIKPQFFSELDVIVKVLQRHPGASAKIEGHADKNAKSKADYNLELSDRRAKAVLEYFVAKGIDRTRLSSKGYGFTMPLETNDPKFGNPKNRRVEVYLTGIDRSEI